MGSYRYKTSTKTRYVRIQSRGRVDVACYSKRCVLPVPSPCGRHSSRQDRTGATTDSVDPETGARYTVKRYESEKVMEDDSWRHTKITLKPYNPAFDPIVISEADEGDVAVVAEFLEVVLKPDQ